jgi:hypothetical protein
MKEIANPFDNEDRIKRNNEWLYFHTPNHPHDKQGQKSHIQITRAERSLRFPSSLTQAGDCK